MVIVFLSPKRRVPILCGLNLSPSGLIRVASEATKPAPNSCRKADGLAVRQKPRNGRDLTIPEPSRTLRSLSDQSEAVKDHNVAYPREGRENGFFAPDFTLEYLPYVFAFNREAALAWHIVLRTTRPLEEYMETGGDRDFAGKHLGTYIRLLSALILLQDSIAIDHWTSSSQKLRFGKYRSRTAQNH